MFVGERVRLWGTVEAEVDTIFRGRIIGIRYECSIPNDRGESGKIAFGVIEGHATDASYVRLVYRLSLACQILPMTGKSEPYVRSI